MPHNGQPTQIRIGIHTGSVVAGLIGTKLPKFSIFGDTMNTASRMESTCRPGCIQVSLAARQLLEGYTFTPTGGIEVKGKGLMETFLWDPEEHPEEQYISVDEQAREAAGLMGHVVATQLSVSGKVPQLLPSCSPWASGKLPGLAPEMVTSAPLPSFRMIMEKDGRYLANSMDSGRIPRLALLEAAYGSGEGGSSGGGYALMSSHESMAGAVSTVWKLHPLPRATSTVPMNLSESFKTPLPSSRASEGGGGGGGGGGGRGYGRQGRYSTAHHLHHDEGQDRSRRHHIRGSKGCHLGEYEEPWWGFLYHHRCRSHLAKGREGNISRRPLMSSWPHPVEQLPGDRAVNPALHIALRLDQQQQDHKKQPTLPGANISHGVQSAGQVLGVPQPASSSRSSPSSRPNRSSARVVLEPCWLDHHQSRLHYPHHPKSRLSEDLGAAPPDSRQAIAIAAAAAAKRLRHSQLFMSHPSDGPVDGDRRHLTSNGCISRGATDDGSRNHTSGGPSSGHAACTSDWPKGPGGHSNHPSLQKAGDRGDNYGPGAEVVVAEASPFNYDQGQGPTDDARASWTNDWAEMWADPSGAVTPQAPGHISGLSRLQSDSGNLPGHVIATVSAAEGKAATTEGAYAAAGGGRFAGDTKVALESSSIHDSLLPSHKASTPEARGAGEGHHFRRASAANTAIPCPLLPPSTTARRYLQRSSSVTADGWFQPMLEQSLSSTCRPGGAAPPGRDSAAPLAPSSSLRAELIRLMMMRGADGGAGAAGGG